MTVTLTGENEFMLHAELEKRLQQFLQTYGDMALERLDGEEVSFERIQESLQSLPFLATAKMVVLWRPSTNKQFVEHVGELLSELPDTTELIIVEPKFDKRSVYYKLLKKSTEFHEYPALERTSLAKWLVTQAKEQGGTLLLSDANYLIERVGGNQQMLFHEVEKLLVYDPKITRETIMLLTEQTPQSTIFELLEATCAGNSRKAMELYDEQRQLKVEPQQVIAMLTWQLHVLALIKTADERSINTIASEAKLNPYVVRKTITIAQHMSLTELKRLVAELLEIDMRLKRQSIDADEALRNFLLRMAS
jgi:DNA polymerase-3 subunit delta